MRSVVLYDVDPLNPYGRELARTLAGHEVQVSLCASRAVRSAPKDVRLLRYCAAPRAIDGTLRTIWFRMSGVLRSIALATRERSPVIVVWSRDALDAAVLVIFRLVSRRPLIVVNHNPTGTRQRSGSAARAERLLKRMATATVIHSQSLSPIARADSPNVHVIAHPSYTGWREQFVVVPRGRDRREPRRVLFLGAIRADKGRDEMPAVIDALAGAGCDVVIAGSGDIPAAWREAADRAHIALRPVGSGEVLEDEALASALNLADVMVAPYIGATQSGSVILALTCDVPVLAYDMGGLAELLTPESLVPTGAGTQLGALARDFLGHPWPTFRQDAAHLDAACGTGWVQLLDELGA